MPSYKQLLQSHTFIMECSAFRCPMANRIQQIRSRSNLILDYLTRVRFQVTESFFGLIWGFYNINNTGRHRRLYRSDIIREKPEDAINMATGIPSSSTCRCIDEKGLRVEVKSSLYVDPGCRMRRGSKHSCHRRQPLQYGQNQIPLPIGGNVHLAHQPHQLRKDLDKEPKPVGASYLVVSIDYLHHMNVYLDYPDTLRRQHESIPMEFILPLPPNQPCHEVFPMLTESLKRAPRDQRLSCQGIRRNRNMRWPLRIMAPNQPSKQIISWSL